MVKVPPCAPPGPPLTGASRNAAPLACAASAHFSLVAGLTVLWSIQTPQAFRADALLSALEAASERLDAATDDASLVEAAGGSVRVVEAPPGNLKVTTAADLATAEVLLNRREHSA